jgi:hypothetical protein
VRRAFQGVRVKGAGRAQSPEGCPRGPQNGIQRPKGCGDAVGGSLRHRAGVSGSRSNLGLTLSRGAGVRSLVVRRACGGVRVQGAFGAGTPRGSPRGDRRVSRLRCTSVATSSIPGKARIASSVRLAQRSQPQPYREHLHTRLGPRGSGATEQRRHCQQDAHGPVHGPPIHGCPSPRDWSTPRSIPPAAQQSASLPSMGCNRPSSTSPTGPDCDTDFDRGTYEEKWRQCKLCERQHRGMGRMELDCKKAIPAPWK